MPLPLDEICHMWIQLLPSVEDILETERTVCTAVQCFADHESAFGVQAGRGGAGSVDVRAVALALLLACGWMVALSHAVRSRGCASATFAKVRE